MSVSYNFDHFGKFWNFFDNFDKFVCDNFDFFLHFLFTILTILTTFDNFEWHWAAFTILEMFGWLDKMVNRPIGNCPRDEYEARQEKNYFTWRSSPAESSVARWPYIVWQKSSASAQLIGEDVWRKARSDFCKRFVKKFKIAMTSCGSGLSHSCWDACLGAILKKLGKFVVWTRVGGGLASPTVHFFGAQLSGSPLSD